MGGRRCPRPSAWFTLANTPCCISFLMMSLVLMPSAAGQIANGDRLFKLDWFTLLHGRLGDRMLTAAGDLLEMPIDAGRGSCVAAIDRITPVR